MSRSKSVSKSSIYKEIAIQIGGATSYFLVAIIVLNFATIEGNNTILWPSSGIALAIILKYGYRYSLGIFLGAIGAGIYVDNPVLTNILIAFGNTIEPIFTVYILRFFPFIKTLHHLKCYLSLITAGSIGAILSALLGNYSLFISGFISLSDFPLSVIRWWMGDSLGIIVVAPFFLLFDYKSFLEQFKSQTFEIISLGLLVIFISCVVLSGLYPEIMGSFNNSYLLSIPLVWAILRFNETAISLIVVEYLVVGIWGLLHLQGVFIDDQMRPDLTYFWAYFVLMSLVAMIMAYKLNELKTIYQAINSSESETYVFSEDDMRFIFVNQAALNNLGVSLPEVLKLTIIDLKPRYSQADFKVLLDWLANKDRTPLNFETIQQRKNGTLHPVEIQLQSIPHSNKRYILASIFDISQRKHVENELAKNQEKLIQLNKELDLRVKEEIEKNHKKDTLIQEKTKLAAMGEMVGNIAHQWRQPLNGVNLILQDLEDADHHNECDSVYISNAVKEANELTAHMSQTIDNFRNFFRSEGEHPGYFNVKDAVDECIAILAVTHKYNHIRVNLDCHDKDISIIGIKHDFKEVLISLLSNAQEALVGNNIPDSVIEITVKTNKDNLELSVCDNGGGIPDNILQKIFDPYFTNKESGTGMGLYLSRVIIEDHMKGHIKVECQNGTTCFLITIPK